MLTGSAKVPAHQTRTGMTNTPYNYRRFPCECQSCVRRRERPKRGYELRREAWEYAALLIIIGILAAVLLYGLP
jgi:hypothetical protein